MELMRALCGVLFVALVTAADSGESMLEVCGVRQLNSKIVGGSDAPVGAWPWHAAIFYSGYYSCGGSLINDQWILTSARCVFGIKPSDLSVHLGSETLEGENPNRVDADVSTVIYHPSFSFNTFKNDIALLNLSSPVTFNNYIRPVCLAKFGSKYEGDYCWVTGFGDLDNGDKLPSSEHLQQVQVPIVPNSECDKIYSNDISEDMMCGGIKDRGVCRNDFGSPLVSQSTNGNRWVQAGVVSVWSQEGCAAEGIPDVYTRVSYFEDWIKSQIVINPPGFVVGEPNSAVTPTPSPDPVVTEPTSAGTPTSSLPLLLLSSSLLLSFVFSQTL